MGNLAATQLNTNSDPALVLQQALANREKQYSAITNPQQQLAARLGGMLGGGLVNLAQDRGFFDINDPLLAKVSQIQGVYNDVASRVDPAADPVAFYNELQQAYSDAGLGKEALMAAQEAQKAKKESISMEAAQYELFNKNPELLDKEIAKAEKAGDDQKVAQLEAIKTRASEARQLDIDYKKAQIDQSKAVAAAQKATAEGKDIIYMTDITGQKIPYERKGDKLIPLQIEGGAPASGAGKGKYNQGKVGRYVNGKVVYD